MSVSSGALVDDLVDADLLAERQAEAFVLREVEGVGREEAAERMGIATSTLDKHLGAARSKVEAAKQTVDLLEDLPVDVLADGLAGYVARIQARRDETLLDVPHGLLKQLEEADAEPEVVDAVIDVHQAGEEFRGGRVVHVGRSDGVLRAVLTARDATALEAYADRVEEVVDGLEVDETDVKHGYAYAIPVDGGEDA